MKLKKLNDTLGRVQVGRINDIPFGKDSKLWFLLVYENGDWDACSITDYGLADEVRRGDLRNVFVVWHGQWRTNLFIVDKKELLNRLKKAGFKAFQ